MAVISHMGTPVPSALEACVIETGFDRSDAQPRTGFMKFGDRVRIEMLDAEGQSIFGAIDQAYVQA